jgi:hypothetical protein
VARAAKAEWSDAPHGAARNSPAGNGAGALGHRPSGLAGWPIQLHLVPPHAPFLHQADLLLVADCVPVAYADFHRRYMNGNPVVLGCPKLDDAAAYVHRLAHMINTAWLQSITVLHMEVPCCTGLLRIAEAAVAKSGRQVPVREVTISVAGQAFHRDELKVSS